MPKSHTLEVRYGILAYIGGRQLLPLEYLLDVIELVEGLDRGKVVDVEAQYLFIP